MALASSSPRFRLWEITRNQSSEELSSSGCPRQIAFIGEGLWVMNAGSHAVDRTSVAVTYGDLGDWAPTRDRRQELRLIQQACLRFRRQGERWHRGRMGRWP